MRVQQSSQVAASQQTASESFFQNQLFTILMAAIHLMLGLRVHVRCTEVSMQATHASQGAQKGRLVDHRRSWILGAQLQTAQLAGAILGGSPTLGHGIPRRPRPYAPAPPVRTGPQAQAGGL